MDIITCPICGTPVDYPEIKVDQQEIDYCPDGYDVVGDDLSMLIPRSGKRETGYITGKTHWRLKPCGCPIDKVSAGPDGCWVVHAYKLKDGGIGLEPIVLKGRFLRPITLPSIKEPT